MRSPGALFLLLSLFVSSANALVVGPEVPVTPPVYGPATATASLPVVASDGSNNLVLWRVGNGPYDVKAVVVSSSNEPRGIPQVLLTDNDVYNLTAVWNGSSYLLAWFSSVQRGIVVARVASDGTLIEGPHTIITHVAMQRHALAWNGHNYLLTYFNSDDGSIGALLLSPSGEIVRRISFPFPQAVTQPIAVGDTFYVVSAGANEFKMFRVSPAGDVLDTQQTTVATVNLLDTFDMATNGRTIVLAVSEPSALATFSIDPATLKSIAWPPVFAGAPYSVSIAS